MRAGRGFSYRDADGKLVGARTRAWIQGLAIPPAWTDVWISPDPDGHLLATGIDARGRKQYRYHAAYRRRRDDRKYERIAAFGAALPRLRRQVDADLRRHGLPREKVVAAVVALLDETSLRVGNDEVLSGSAKSVHRIEGLVHGARPLERRRDDGEAVGVVCDPAHRARPSVEIGLEHRPPDRP